MIAEDNPMDDIPADRDSFEAWEKQTVSDPRTWKPTGVIPGDDPGTPTHWIADDGHYIAAFNNLDDAVTLVSAMAELESVKRENAALRREVNVLRARLGEGRKYVEWSDKPKGGCPVDWDFWNSWTKTEYEVG